MKKSQIHLRKILSRTTLNPVWCDLTEDQRRLREHFDDGVILRFSYITDEFQVWYETNWGELSCLLTIPRVEYNICKIIWLLEQKQKSKRELLAEYERIQNQKEQESNKKIAETSGTMADAALSHAVGKVSCSFDGN